MKNPKKGKAKRQPIRIENRKARFNYEHLETFSAGIVLLGSEVKSIREGRVSLVDSFCYFDKDELWAKNIELTPTVTHYAHDPKRPKKLLLTKDQLESLSKGLIPGRTIIVFSIMESRGRFKAMIALAKGRKDYDKRQLIKDRDTRKELKEVI
jgi:SsrA-binding protein